MPSTERLGCRRAAPPSHCDDHLSACGSSVVRRRLASWLALLVLSVSAVACSSGSSGAPPSSKVATLPPTTAEPAGCDVAPAESASTGPGRPSGTQPAVGSGVVPTLPPGVDTGYSGSGPGSGNPYTVPGARPVPGPNMPVTTLGPDPLTVVVVVPPNPDVGTPAATPADATTVAPKPTTIPDAVTSSTVAPAAKGTTTTGLTALADDPGCVSSPGQP